VNDEPLAVCNLCEPPRRVFASEVPAHLRVVHGLVMETEQMTAEKVGSTP
jgi:hypothetical protein